MRLLEEVAKLAELNGGDDEGQFALEWLLNLELGDLIDDMVEFHVCRGASEAYELIASLRKEE